MQEDYDLREAVRVMVTLPVRFDVMDHAGQAHRLPARTINFSRSGACLQLNARPELLSGLAMLQFPAAQSHAGAHELSAPDSALPAWIVWSAPDLAAFSEFRHQGSGPAML